MRGGPLTLGLGCEALDHMPQQRLLLLREVAVRGDLRAGEGEEGEGEGGRWCASERTSQCAGLVRAGLVRAGLARVVPVGGVRS